MGAAQSGLKIEPSKSNLYDLLSVDRTADNEQIRKAYKKLALKLHPDRNIGKEQEAATQFAKVLAAYETLIDLQEREWYDKHDEAAEYSEYSAKITKSAELRQYMDPTYVKTLNPQKDDFYRLVSELFERLRNEELEAGFELGVDQAAIPVAEAPLFGHIDAQWQQTKAFYDTWSSFSSLKSFEWEDVYRVREDDDRKSRRAMQARNKRVRDSAKKEYNDTVRSLVRLAYTQDIRVKKQQLVSEKRQADKKAKEEERRRQRKAEEASAQVYQEQEWAKVESQGDFECIVCEQTFSSDIELATHEQTKEHAKLLEKLQQQMIQEDAIMNRSPQESPTPKAASPDIEELADETAKLSVEDIMSQMDQHSRKKKVEPVEPKEKKSKAKKRKQQRLQAQEANLKCRTCQSVFGSLSDLQEHCRVSKHVAPVLR